MKDYNDPELLAKIKAELEAYPMSDDALDDVSGGGREPFGGKIEPPKFNEGDMVFELLQSPSRGNALILAGRKWIQVTSVEGWLYDAYFPDVKQEGNVLEPLCRRV